MDNKQKQIKMAFDSLFSDIDALREHIMSKTRYHSSLKKCYVVKWEGKIYSSNDTKDLVEQVLKDVLDKPHKS